MRIGQLARATGVAVDTVRFYERHGLLAAAARRSSNYRDFPPEAVARLRFIREAKELGFTLREIRAFLALRVTERTDCRAMEARVRRKIDEIEARIGRLRLMQQSLAALIEDCRRHRPTGECGVLRSLEGDWR